MNMTLYGLELTVTPVLPLHARILLCLATESNGAVTAYGRFQDDRKQNGHAELESVEPWALVSGALRKPLH